MCKMKNSRELMYNIVLTANNTQKVIRNIDFRREMLGQLGTLAQQISTGIAPLRGK